jgi:2-keto-4-pentenoate hydratase/2-oxohepta-3-ene-1,7-dioic acid hydratase in catechol pathway
MGFKILRFIHKGATQWGVLKGEKITPFGVEVIQLKTILNHHLNTAKTIAKDGAAGQIDLATVEVISPVTRPTRLLCLGVNYTEHRQETKTSKHQTDTLFFRKDESSITAPYAEIPWPAKEPLLDYEVEMGMIIKKDIRQATTITKDNIDEYIGGIILANDLSPRLTMITAPFGQWYKGKSWRNMCPIGPYIYIFDKGEAAKLHDLEIKLWVNEELRQEAHTSQLITKPEKALSEASQFVDLEVGDIVLTGTPGGVAVKAPHPTIAKLMQLLISPKKLVPMMVKKQLESGKFLKPGDIVRCSLKSSDGAIDCGEQRVKIIS